MHRYLVPTSRRRLTSPATRPLPERSRLGHAMTRMGGNPKRILGADKASFRSTVVRFQSGIKAPSKSRAVLPEWIVNHPTTVSAVPVLGNLAYLSLASGFLCKDILSLRLLLVGGYGGLVAYHALRPVPLKIPLRWSAFFVLVNASMAAVLVWDNLPPALTSAEEDLHVQHFAPLSRKQFHKLLNLSKTEIFRDGDCLTVANTPSDKLYFILEGTAHMTSASGKHISKLREGAFPNCMSFQRSGWDSYRRKTEDGSYGTIQCKGSTICLVWHADDLLPWLENDEDARLRMDHAVIEAVMRRLLVDPEGANVKDYIRVISKGWAHTTVQQRKIQSMKTGIHPQQQQQQQQQPPSPPPPTSESTTL